MGTSRIRPPYSSAEAAYIAGQKIQTLRSSYCLRGHWLGLKPVKLPNGHLRWNADQVDALVQGKGGKND